MPTYEITAVEGEPRQWSSKQNPGATFLAYRCDMRGPDGIVTKGVEWSRKSSSPAPQIGERHEFELEDRGSFGWRAKKVSSGGFNGGGPRPEDPKRSAAILRQHSQHMALLYVASQPSDKQPGSWAEFWALVDRFDDDVHQAREAVR